MVSPSVRRSLAKTNVTKQCETPQQDLQTARRAAGTHSTVVLIDATNTESTTRTRTRPLRRSPRYSREVEDTENCDTLPPACEDNAAYEPIESEESSTSYLATSSSHSSLRRHLQSSESLSACATSEWSESTQTDVTLHRENDPFLQTSSVSEDTDSPGPTTNAKSDVPFSYHRRFQRKMTLSETSSDSDSHANLRYPLPPPAITRESSVSSFGDGSETRAGSLSSNRTTPEPALCVLAATPKIDLPSSTALCSDGSHTGSADVSDNCYSSSSSAPFLPPPSPLAFSGLSGIDTSEDASMEQQATLVEARIKSTAASSAHQIKPKTKSLKTQRDQSTIPGRTSARKNPNVGLGPKHLEYDLQMARDELREATINACFELGYKPRPRHLSASQPRGLMTRNRKLAFEAKQQEVWKPSLEQVNAAGLWYVKRAKRRYHQAFEKLQEAKERGETWDNTPVPSLSSEAAGAASEPFLPSDRTSLFDSQEHKTIDLRAYSAHCKPEVDVSLNGKFKRSSHDDENVEHARPSKRLRSRECL
ncbi:hypothetical protein K474DRAFT_1712342 [Panus rudis PR-1116 ss-1]|nr:hypothetical protein K474DRAFT_1712342 [Panus rudis PR-1116 ss-1]